MLTVVVVIALCLAVAVSPSFAGSNKDDKTVDTLVDEKVTGKDKEKEEKDKNENANGNGNAFGADKGVDTTLVTLPKEVIPGPIALLPPTNGENGTAVPEPGTLALLGTALAGGLGYRLRRRR